MAAILGGEAGKYKPSRLVALNDFDQEGLAGRPRSVIAQSVQCLNRSLRSDGFRS